MEKPNPTIREQTDEAQRVLADLQERNPDKAVEVSIDGYEGVRIKVSEKRDNEVAEDPNAAGIIIGGVCTAIVGGFLYLVTR